MKESTNDILSKYRKQLEEDKKNSANNPYGNLDELNYTDSELEEYKKSIDDYSSQSDELEKQYQKFHEMYPKISEQDMDNNGMTKLEDIKVMVKRAYCPKCGKELVSEFPVMFNPYTKEKIAKHDCSCGFKANLEFAYPRLVYIDKDGNEIKAFGI